MERLARGGAGQRDGSRLFYLSEAQLLERLNGEGVEGKVAEGQIPEDADAFFHFSVEF